VTDIFQEVEEEVRREQLKRLWQTYGKYVTAVGVVIVALAVGMVAWKEYQGNQRLAAGDAFAEGTALLDAGRFDEAAAKFTELAVDATGGYVELAKARAALARAAAGDRGGAIEAYDDLASYGGADPELRDLARLNAAMLLLEGGESGEIESRLEPLLDEDGPWRYSANEVRALLALRDGDTAAASRILGMLAEGGQTPEGLRARASELMAALGSVGEAEE
jgi:hypothetical protein